MPRLGPMGILMIALFIYGSFAAAKEEDDTAKLNNKDKGFAVPCNCTTWTCPRTFKGHCPPGPKCQHSQCKPIVAPDGSYCKLDDKCYVGYGKCKGGICSGDIPIKCPPSSQQCKVLTCDPASGFCTILSSVEDETICRNGRCVNGQCIRSPIPVDPSPSTRPPRPSPSTRPPRPSPSTRPPRPSPSTRPPRPSPSPKPPKPSPSPRPPRPSPSPGPDQCPTPEDPCKDAVRNPTTGRCVEQNAPNGRRCDDEDGCTRNDRCRNGVCVGRPKVCTQPSNPCKISTCDTDTGECVEGNADPGTSCPDGECAAGICIDLGPQACPVPTNPCLVSDFDSQQNQCVERPGNEGRACSDGNRCTNDDKCTSGQCIGTPLVCTSTELCKVGQCNSDTGLCEKVNAADGIPCDDGSICTMGTTCRSGVCQGGNPFVCSTTPPVNQCKQRICNPLTNQCEDINKPDGSGCDLGNACTRDTCQGGVCVAGTATDCRQFDTECTVGVCQAASGFCLAQPRNEGRVCDDGKPCTVGTTCQNGVCQGGSLATCPAPTNQCKTAVCDDLTGRCEEVNRPAGTPCSRIPGTCTSDVCQAGVCVAGPEIPGFCSAFNGNNDCRVGFCNTTTGSCSVRDAQVGTPCEDGLVCTVGTTCDGGVCQGGSALQCPPLTGVGNQCKESWCNPAAARTNTACQTRDKPNGSVCVDPAPGCSSDTCDGGTCVKGPVSNCSTLDGPCTEGQCINRRCQVVNIKEGDICPSTDQCLQGTECSSGDCTGGTPVTCDQTGLALCKKRVCLPFGGCTVVDATDGTTCDRGGCTVDECQGGQCVGIRQTAGSCPGAGLQQCQQETCNIVTGQCEIGNKPTGDSCDDGYKCTDNDQCTASGQCAGTPKFCPDPSQCKSSSCNSNTGLCADAPKNIGGSCTDAADPCLVNTVCQTDGTCGGGTPNPNCQAPLPTSPNLSTSPGVSTSPDPGLTCIPGSCTAPSEPQCQRVCDNQGTCVTESINENSACTVTNPDPCKNYACRSGVCTDIGAKPAGDPCNDNNLCTINDRCNAQGQCSGTPKCPGGNQCFKSTCIAATGQCVVDIGKTCTLPGNNKCITDPKCQADGTCAGTETECTLDLSKYSDECAEAKCNPQNGNCVTDAVRDGLPCEDDNGDCGATCSPSGKCQGGRPCVGVQCSKTVACPQGQCCCSNICITPPSGTTDCGFFCAQDRCNKKGKEQNLNCNCIKACGLGSDCSSVGGNPCRRNGVCCCATTPTATTVYGAKPHCEKCRDPCTGGNSCTGNLPTAQKEAVCTAPSVLPPASG